MEVSLDNVTGEASLLVRGVSLGDGGLYKCEVTLACELETKICKESGMKLCPFPGDLPGRVAAPQLPAARGAAGAGHHPRPASQPRHHTRGPEVTRSTSSWSARVGKVIFKNTIPPQNICFDV